MPLAWAASLSIRYDAEYLLLDNVSGLNYHLGMRKYERTLMKLMIVLAVAGTALIALGFAVGSELITINPMKTSLLTAAVLFIVGGVAGISDIWNNRSMRFRRTRRGN